MPRPFHSVPLSVCLLSAVIRTEKKMPLSNELHQTWWSKHLSGPLGNNSIKKRGREEVGEVKGLEGGNGMDREGGKKTALNGYQMNAGKSVVPDD